MIGVQGVGGVQEPQGPKPASGRAKEAEETKATSSDDVSFSSRAEKAAEADAVIQQSGQTSEVRQARIDEARHNIEQGTYKVQEVVQQVAARLTQFVS